MPAAVLFDLKSGLKSDPARESRIPAPRSFRLAVAVVLATLSAVALALVGNSAGTVAIAIPVTPFAGPASVASAAADPAAVPDAPAAPPVQLRREDERDIAALSSAVARRYRVSDEAIRDVVRASYEEARRNRLDPLLVVAVIAIESRFNPFAQSQMGALGLMQVIPQFHADKFDAGEESMLDPQINIRVGTRVLHDYIARGGNEAAGLQMYSGGSDENGVAYANKIAAEKQRLQAAMRRLRAQASPVA